MIFSKAEAKSVTIAIDTIKDFTKLSSLQINSAKSFIFICATSNTTKEQLIVLTGFKLGNLPVHYLGVPFVFARLSAKDC